jgi:D-xylose transport system ATP-binding protein
VNGAEPLLEVRGATKSYGAVRALYQVDLELQHGETLALLGDNGAGKSTLIKALAGAHQLDEGEVLIEGEAVHFRTPVDARRAGVETLFQDLALFDNLSATANFFIGRELTRPSWMRRLAFLQERGMTADWQAQLEQLGVRIKDSTQPIGVLSGGQRQAVAVIRAVAFATRIVILDEPTAALGLRESRQILDLIKRLPEHGVSTILISHNLEHVMEVADHAVVLRQGRRVGDAVPSPDNHERLVSLIVGAESGAPEQQAKHGGFS